MLVEGLGGESFWPFGVAVTGELAGEKGGVANEVLTPELGVSLTPQFGVSPGEGLSGSFPCGLVGVTSEFLNGSLSTSCDRFAPAVAVGVTNFSIELDGCDENRRRLNANPRLS